MQSQGQEVAKPEGCEQCCDGNDVETVNRPPVVFATPNARQEADANEVVAFFERPVTRSRKRGCPPDSDRSHSCAEWVYGNCRRLPQREIHSHVHPAQVTRLDRFRHIFSLIHLT
jgi:hypothetical protein